MGQEANNLVSQATQATAENKKAEQTAAAQVSQTSMQATQLSNEAANAEQSEKDAQKKKDEAEKAQDAAEQNLKTAEEEAKKAGAVDAQDASQLQTAESTEK